jgi:uncharacterized membrane protein YdjX (TVP38/TMEM64 family)
VAKGPGPHAGGFHRPTLDDFVFEGEATPLLLQRRVVGSVIALFVALVAGYIVTSSLLGFSTEINAEPLRDWVEGYGAWGPVLFIAVMAASVLVAPIPNAPVFAVAGLVWGTVLGTAYSLIGLLIGSALAFYAARLLGRRHIGRLVGHKAAARLDTLAETMGGRVIFWSRMLPGINFDWISFLAGMTSIPFHVFFVYSALGMVLPTGVTVVAGDGLGRDFRITLAAGAIYVAGLAGAAGFFWYRRRAWKQERARKAAASANPGKGMGNANQ